MLNGLKWERICFKASQVLEVLSRDSIKHWVVSASHLLGNWKVKIYPLYLKYPLTVTIDVAALCAEPESLNIHNAVYSQPLVTAIQVALVNLFAEWKINPSLVVGHSSGASSLAWWNFSVLLNVFR